ncbi:hypothetical protein [Azospirillum sp.]|uniref:hypothetical protein n=1 Tax=Azospirillum sp. TaxID=34012 RepID=UPI003D749EF6
MLDPNLFADGASSGEMQGDAVAALAKALEAGYGTDVSQLTGGAALRVQSLDTTMQAVIQENEDFKLFNRLAKPKAGATVDEWTEQNGIGGFLGGSTNTETGTIEESTGSYARRVGMVKFLMTKRQVSLVQTLQNTLADSEATEYNNGALELLSNAEYLCFEGDDTVVPTEFSGIFAQMVQGVADGHVDGGNIIDHEATSLDSIVPINKAAAQIRKFGNFGRLTDIYFSPLVQADLDNSLDPAFRVALNNAPNSIMLGTPVVGIRATGGNIGTTEDIFIRDEELQTPFELRYPTYAAKQVGLKPAAVAGVAAADAQSKFKAGHAGNYYYLVTGVNAKGQSTGLISAQVAVGAGDKVTLSITKSAAGEETGYVIYRSRKNGTNAVDDFREMVRIGRTGNTTTYVDYNRDIPGTTKAYLLDMRAGQTAINWRQLLPMMKFQLFPNNQPVIPWAQLLFGYLRITKRRHMAVIKNILPNGAIWRPFN